MSQLPRMKPNICLHSLLTQAEKYSFQQRMGWMVGEKVPWTPRRRRYARNFQVLSRHPPTGVLIHKSYDNIRLGPLRVRHSAQRVHQKGQLPTSKPFLRRLPAPATLWNLANCSPNYGSLLLTTETCDIRRGLNMERLTTVQKLI